MYLQHLKDIDFPATLTQISKSLNCKQFKIFISILQNKTYFLSWIFSTINCLSPKLFTYHPSIIINCSIYQTLLKPISLIWNFVAKTHIRYSNKMKKAIRKLYDINCKRQCGLEAWFSIRFETNVKNQQYIKISKAKFWKWIILFFANMG